MGAPTKSCERKLRDYNLGIIDDQAALNLAMNLSTWEDQLRGDLSKPPQLRGDDFVDIYTRRWEFGLARDATALDIVIYLEDQKVYPRPKPYCDPTYRRQRRRLVGSSVLHHLMEEIDAS